MSGKELLVTTGWFLLGHKRLRNQVYLPEGKVTGSTGVSILCAEFCMEKGLADWSHFQNSLMYSMERVRCMQKLWGVYPCGLKGREGSSRLWTVGKLLRVCLADSWVAYNVPSLTSLTFISDSMSFHTVTKTYSWTSTQTFDSDKYYNCHPFTARGSRSIQIFWYTYPGIHWMAVWTPRMTRFVDVNIYLQRMRKYSNYSTITSGILSFFDPISELQRSDPHWATHRLICNWGVCLLQLNDTKLRLTQKNRKRVVLHM